MHYTLTNGACCCSTLAAMAAPGVGETPRLTEAPPKKTVTAAQRQALEDARLSKAQAAMERKVYMAVQEEELRERLLKEKEERKKKEAEAAAVVAAPAKAVDDDTDSNKRTKLMDLLAERLLLKEKEKDKGKKKHAKEASSSSSEDSSPPPAKPAKKTKKRAKPVTKRTRNVFIADQADVARRGEEEEEEDVAEAELDLEEGELLEEEVPPPRRRTMRVEYDEDPRTQQGYWAEDTRRAPSPPMSSGAQLAARMWGIMRR